jgi:hypothetical protein
MDRLEPSEGFPFARLNCRTYGSTPSATEHFCAVRRAMASAILCLVALASPAVARAANISVCESGCDTRVAAAGMGRLCDTHRLMLCSRTFLLALRTGQDAATQLEKINTFSRGGSNYNGAPCGDAVRALVRMVIGGKDSEAEETR